MITITTKSNNNNETRELPALFLSSGGAEFELMKINRGDVENHGKKAENY